MWLSSGSHIWLAAAPVDMRLGFDGLTAKVQGVLAADPFCGHAFVFRNRRGDRLKLIALGWSGLLALVPPPGSGATALAQSRYRRRGTLHSTVGDVGGGAAVDPVAGPGKMPAYLAISDGNCLYKYPFLGTILP